MSMVLHDCPSRTADHGYFAHEQHEPVTFEGSINDLRYGSIADNATVALIDDVTCDLFNDLSYEQMRKLLCLMLDSEDFHEVVSDRIQDYVSGF